MRLDRRPLRLNEQPTQPGSCRSPSGATGTPTRQRTNCGKPTTRTTPRTPAARLRLARRRDQMAPTGRREEADVAEPQRTEEEVEVRHLPGAEEAARRRLERRRDRVFQRTTLRLPKPPQRSQRPRDLPLLASQRRTDLRRRERRTLLPRPRLLGLRKRHLRRQRLRRRRMRHPPSRRRNTMLTDALIHARSRPLLQL